MKPGPKATPWELRFLNMIDAHGDNECWPWIGSRLPRGYGTFEKGYAHRIAYEMFVGPIPEGMSIRHTCDNPPCCNPAHLLAGTQQDNLDDMVSRGRSNRAERHWNWQGGNSRNYLRRLRRAAPVAVVAVGHGRDEQQHEADEHQDHTDPEAQQ